MPSFCQYRMCHNLASSNYQGYCNKDHHTRGKILEFKEQISTLNATVSVCLTPLNDTVPIDVPKGPIVSTCSSYERSEVGGDGITSSSRYEACTKSPHG